MDNMNYRHSIEALGTGKANHAARQSVGRSVSQGMHPRAILRVLILAVALHFMAFAPLTVRAQSALEASQIVVGASAQPKLGSPLTVQALLADSQGRPISNAVVYFVTSESFLKDTGDVVLAQALTNADGQAVAEFVNNFSDSITLRAEFRGDEQYAASNADTQIGAVNQGQVYVEHVGVDIPGFNVPPVLGASRAAVQSSRFEIGRFVQSLWPAMNGWPVAAVLIIVWSLYLFAVRFVLRVAALGSEAGESTSVESSGAM